MIHDNSKKMLCRFIVKMLFNKNLSLNLKAQFCLIDVTEVGNLDIRQHCNPDMLFASLHFFKS